MDAGGKLVLGGTAGAGEEGAPLPVPLPLPVPPLPVLVPTPAATPVTTELPFSGLFDRAPCVPGDGTEPPFGGWLTCSRFLRVTSSVLKLLRRCCRCTASFEDEASVMKVNRNGFLTISRSSELNENKIN